MNSARRSPQRSATAEGANCIRIRGARQNNLRSVDLDIPVGSFTVVTGLSGSGKSSLVFDTIYAEGQRRYVETFSPYARQFLERLPPPAVDSVDGIPPAVAIRQSNPVRNSRSTVATMTELHDHAKQLFASCARPFCPNCARFVEPSTPDSAALALLSRFPEGTRCLVAFEAELPNSVSEDEARALLSSQGWTRVRRLAEERLRVDVDAVSLSPSRRARLAEAFETALAHGHGTALAIPVAADRSEGPPIRFSSRLECPDCGHSFEPPSPNLFSFNSPVGACPKCRGFGRVIGVSEALVVPDPALSVAQGCIKPFQTTSFDEVQKYLVKCAKRRRFPLDTPWNALSPEDRKWAWDGESDDWENGLWPGVAGFFRWLESRTYKLHVRVMLSRYREYTPCPDCGGARLRPAALDWRVEAGGRSHTAASLASLTVSQAREFLVAVRDEATPGTPRGDAARAVLDGVLPRLGFIEEAGAGYLALDRASRTLSGGEAQRLALVSALGSNLVGTLFVLDEPSVGLHPRDIDRLVAILRRLRDAGNTVLVVEHDPAVILAADRVVELGPGPGENGGRVVFEGSVPELLRSRVSVSAPYLKPERPRPLRSADFFGTLPVAAEADAPPPGGGTVSKTARKRPGGRRAAGSLRLLGATEHNLKGIDVEFPLGRFSVVTGVSGSGKSTLVCDVLYPAVRRALGLPAPECGAHRAVEGAEALGGVELVDQSPIGKSARSTPASFVGAFDEIRKVFAALPAAKARGMGVGDFSFNSGLGRCPECEGSGFEHIEMQFLSDVYLPCEACGGRRYRAETLAVTMPCEALGRELSIADVLELTVTEAIEAFAGAHGVLAGLKPLADVGLGYLKLGQPVPTLSGGEAQRLKLAGFLAGLDAEGAGGSKAAIPRARGAAGAASGDDGAKARRKGSLLLFDEPTTGLHFRDIEVLLGVMRRLCAQGHTVVAIEHNIQTMRAADFLIDLGPEGGDKGGRIVAAGSPTSFLDPSVPGATAAALRAN